MASILTAALYRFADLPDCAQLRAPLQALCDAEGVRGLLLLAPEGINGTIAGPPAGVEAVLAWLRSQPGLAGLHHKSHWGELQPFHRMRVRVKSEIVTLGVPGVDAAHGAGTYVQPQDWNRLLDDPEVVVIDVRNDYEVAIGSFEGALNPHTASFRDFPAWADAAAALRDKPKVAMFCTGGIRCEKSTALLRARGFGEVYHLEGGILAYLEQVPPAESRWQGECFVFDERVAVGQGLAPGTHTLCRACRQPLTAQDRAAPQYQEGVSCPHCHGHTTEAQKAGYAERHRQVLQAAERGERHVGAVLPGPGPKAAADAAAATALPVLYSFRRCPYAMRARLALLASGRVCELREVVLARKPQALLEASPKGTVPVLVLPGGQVLQESRDIMDWVLSQADPQGWRAAPDDGDATALAALVDACDQGFKADLDRYKYPVRYPDSLAPGGALAHRDRGADYLQALDDRLRRQGAPGACLGGAAPRWADAAIAPFVRQFAQVDADWFAAQPWPHLQAWLAGFLAWPLLAQAMEKFASWAPGDAPVHLGGPVAGGGRPE